MVVSAVVALTTRRVAARFKRVRVSGLRAVEEQRSGMNGQWAAGAVNQAGLSAAIMAMGVGRSVVQTGKKSITNIGDDDEEMAADLQVGKAKKYYIAESHQGTGVDVVNR